MQGVTGYLHLGAVGRIDFNVSAVSPMMGRPKGWSGKKDCKSIAIPKSLEWEIHGNA